MNREYLIVDDEPDLCWALKNLLTSKGLPCQEAQTAQAALDLMKTHRFQLAFLDVTLPDMNGLELARHLRKLDPFLRFVIVSGYISKVLDSRTQGYIFEWLDAGKPSPHPPLSDSCAAVFQ